MQLMVGLRSAWKCVQVSLQDGSVPVIGGVALPDFSIEPAIWFKALVLDCVCVDCSDHMISWTVGNSTVQHSVPSSLHHTLMAPHEEGQPTCPDNLHNLFQLAETLFRVSPLCSPSHRTPSQSSQEAWEQQSWLRLLHTLLLPILTLHREDLPPLQQTLTHHCTHTITALDTSMAQNSAQSLQLKKELVIVRSALLSQVPSAKSCPPLLLSYLTSDLKDMENEARSKFACCAHSLALRSQLSDTSALSQDKLEADKTEAERELMYAIELRATLDSQPCMENTGPLAIYSEGIVEHYLELQEKLNKVRATGSHLSRKKVLALSVREAMEQAVASLQAGHVTAGIDSGLHGGHSTDVLQEATQYQARDEFTTLSERMKHLLDMSHSPASQCHTALNHAVERDWFPTMCSNGFVVVSPDMVSRSLSTRNPRGWRRHFTLRSRAQSSPVRPIPSSMAEAGQLLHCHFHQIVNAICDYFSDHDTGFQQQVWLSYEKLFFDTFFVSFISQYRCENLKFCEQLRVNALSASVLLPSSLALDLPQTSWLTLFSPRPFEEAVEFYAIPLDVDLYSDPPKLHSTLEPYFSSVVSDLYCMARARAPLEKLQLLTSAFRKTTATLSDLILQTTHEFEDGSTDMQLAGVSCDDLLPLLVLLLLQLPPAFLANLWLHCLLLEDCCPAFLQAGWHGYSLTTFRSTLKIIAEL